MFITRKIEFSASHVCANPALPEEENRRLFGDAANPYGHGHNYVVEVTLEGDPDNKINVEYGTLKFPETYIIDARGKVVRKIISNTDWMSERMLKDVESLL